MKLGLSQNKKNLRKKQRQTGSKLKQIEPLKMNLSKLIRKKLKLNCYNLEMEILIMIKLKCDE